MRGLPPGPRTVGVAQKDNEDSRNSPFDPFNPYLKTVWKYSESVKEREEKLKIITYQAIAFSGNWDL